MYTHRSFMDQEKEMPYPQVREMWSQDTVRREGAGMSYGKYMEQQFLQQLQEEREKRGN